MFAKEKITVRTNLLFRNLLFHLIFWYVSLLLFVFLTGNERLFSKYGEFLHIKSTMLTHLVLAAVLAIFFTFIDGLFNDRLLRNSSAKLMMISSSLTYFIFGIILMLLAPMSPKAILAIRSADHIAPLLPALDIDLLRFLVFFYLICILSNFVRRMMKRLGKGNFTSWFFGMMNKPREDERIFMFLDMKSSTRIAESLSHEKFSHLVQDIFNDLAVVDNYVGEIYQYLGDGAIISWPVEKGLKNNNFLKAYYGFINLIQRRENYYYRKYDLLPKFKASAHVGKVMVLQVGRIRRDISYNGDTINTAARIESMCNDFNKNLLISGDLYNLMTEREGYFIKQVGNLRLKGKRRKVDVLHVRPKKAYKRQSSPYLRVILDKLNIFKRRVSDQSEEIKDAYGKREGSKKQELENQSLRKAG